MSQPHSTRQQQSFLLGPLSGDRGKKSTSTIKTGIQNKSQFFHITFSLFSNHTVFSAVNNGIVVNTLVIKSQCSQIEKYVTRSFLFSVSFQAFSQFFCKYFYFLQFFASDFFQKFAGSRKEVFFKEGSQFFFLFFFKKRDYFSLFFLFKT